MNDDEKKIGQVIMAALDIMPDSGRKYILGYAEGMLELAEAIRRGPEMGDVPQ